MRVVTLPGVSKKPLVGVDHKSRHHFVFEDGLSRGNGSSEVTVTDKGKMEGRGEAGAAWVETGAHRTV